MDYMEQQAVDTVTDQRVCDRRKPSLATLHGTLFKGRRRQARRQEDQINSYLDWHGYKPPIAALLITLLCFADAFLTTILLGKGATEVNVLMDWLIQRDIHAFTIVKMVVTGIALLVLLIHSNFVIYRYITVRYVIYALVPVYVLLILHEINLLTSI